MEHRDHVTVTGETRIAFVPNGTYECYRIVNRRTGEMQMFAIASGEDAQTTLDYSTAPNLLRFRQV